MNINGMKRAGVMDAKHAAGQRDSTGLLHSLYWWTVLMLMLMSFGTDIPNLDRHRHEETCEQTKKCSISMIYHRIQR